MSKNVELFDAIEAGDVARVRLLLDGEPGLAATRSPEGASAVLAARYRQNQDLVDAVLEARPELDVFDAAALGRADRLTELLDAEPELVNAWARDGFSPLSLAAFFGQPPAVALLLDRGADVGAISRNAMQVQPLHAATAARNAEAVTLLLEAGADPNARQHGGWTPLAAARHAGQDAIAELLLAHGANPSPAEPAPPAEATSEATSTASATTADA